MLQVLSDPTFGKLEELLAGLDFSFPQASVLGGLSSAGGAGRLRSIANAAGARVGDARPCC